MHDMENAGYENKRHLLCIDRVLVRNAVFGVACFIGFVRIEA